MEFTPYLAFAGNCAEAFEFYNEVFGGELEMMTHGDSPIADEIPEEIHDRVINASLTIGDALLMGADMMSEDDEAPQGYSVAIELDDPDEARRVFEELAEGGRITMPMEKTFWAELFGMVTDKFGTPWMVNYE